MEVILQNAVTNLGNVGDIVKVTPGYARNYLFPKKIALPVTEENRKDLEAKRAVLEKEALEILKQAKGKAEKMANMKLELTLQAKETGELFGSVSLTEIVNLIEKAGNEVDKKSLHIAEGAIKTVGEFTVIIQLHPEVKFNIPLIIHADLTTTNNLANEESDNQ